MNYIAALIFKLFRLPAIPQMLMAIPVLALAFMTYSQSAELEKEIATAMASDPPPLIGPKDYDRKLHEYPAKEINLQVRIDTKYNSSLTQKRNLVTTAERLMYVFFDVSDPFDSKIPRGAILFPVEKKDDVSAYLLKNLDVLANLSSDSSPATFVANINGKITGSQGVGSVVDKAFSASGLKRHSNFIYISPYLDGRAAGLEKAANYQATYVFVGLAGIFLLLGFMRLGKKPATSQRSNPTPKQQTNGPISRQSNRLSAMPAPNSSAAKDGPLARIAAREARERSANFEQPQPVQAPLPEAVYDGPTYDENPKMHKVPWLEAVGLAAVIFAGVVFWLINNFPPILGVVVALVLHVVVLRPRIRKFKLGSMDYFLQCFKRLTGQIIDDRPLKVSNQSSTQNHPQQTKPDPAKSNDDIIPKLSIAMSTPSTRNVGPPINPDGKIRIDHDPFAVIERTKREAQE